MQATSLLSPLKLDSRNPWRSQGVNLCWLGKVTWGEELDDLTEVFHVCSPWESIPELKDQLDAAVWVCKQIRRSRKSTHISSRQRAAGILVFAVPEYGEMFSLILESVRADMRHMFSQNAQRHSAGTYSLQQPPLSAQPGCKGLKAIAGVSVRTL